jgi:mono/diheme cytochrome c family protein
MSKSAFVCAILLLAGFATAPSSALADGAELYSKNCALCHGADGQKEAGPQKKTIAGRDAAAVWRARRSTDPSGGSSATRIWTRSLPRSPHSAASSDRPARRRGPVARLQPRRG